MDKDAQIKGKNSPRVKHCEYLKKYALAEKARGNEITVNADKYPELKEWAEQNNIPFEPYRGKGLTILSEI